MDIIVVTFNRAEYLKRCVNSLLATKDDRDRVIVVDNASFDGTSTLLEGYGQSFDRTDFTHLSLEKNVGCGTGRNTGFWFGNAGNRNEFVMLSDDDFLFHPGWRDACLKAFDANPNLGLVSAHDDQRNDKVKAIAEYTGFRLLYRANLAHGCCMVRRKAFRQVCGYPVTNKVMGFFGTEFCRKIREAGWHLCIVKPVGKGGPIVEHMDHPHNKLCLRHYYERTGYEDFRRAAKRGAYTVGEDLRPYLSLDRYAKASYIVGESGVNLREYRHRKTLTREEHEKLRRYQNQLRRRTNRLLKRLDRELTKPVVDSDN